MELQLSMEDASDKSMESQIKEVLDPYPPKMERQETEESNDGPPQLLRMMLSPTALLSEITDEILSDFAAKGKEMEAKLGIPESAEETARETKETEEKAPEKTTQMVTPKTTKDTFTPSEQQAVRQDAMERKNAMLEQSARNQSRYEEAKRKTQERLDALREKQEDNIRKMTTFDPPKYNGL